jgi:ferredoxin
MRYDGDLRVRVNRDKCTGHGRCYARAEDVYAAFGEVWASVTMHSSRRELNTRRRKEPVDLLKLLFDPGDRDIAGAAFS